MLTSRRFMEKMQLKLDAELVYLEDFKDASTWSDKLAGASAPTFARWRCWNDSSGSTR